MSSNFLLEDDLLLNEKLNLLTKTQEKDKKDNKLYKIIYNKKWLIIIGLLIIGIIIYLYYYNISFTLPCLFTIPNIKNKKKCPIKKENKEEDEDEGDEEEEDEETDKWILEDEIKNYMQKQHEYISELK